MGVSMVLVGEALMRAKDPAKAIRTLLGKEDAALVSVLCFAVMHVTSQSGHVLLLIVVILSYSTRSCPPVEGSLLVCFVVSCTLLVTSYLVRK